MVWYRLFYDQTFHRGSRPSFYHCVHTAPVTPALPATIEPCSTKSQRAANDDPVGIIKQHQKRPIAPPVVCLVSRAKPFEDSECVVTWRFWSFGPVWTDSRLRSSETKCKEKQTRIASPSCFLGRMFVFFAYCTATPVCSVQAVFQRGNHVK